MTQLQRWEATSKNKYVFLIYSDVEFVAIDEDQVSSSFDKTVHVLL